MNELKQEITNSIHGIDSMTIRSQEDLAKMTAIVQGINGLIKKVKETFDPIVKKAKDAHTEALAQKKRHLFPLESAKEKATKLIVTYNEEERMRQLAEKEEKKAEAEEAEDFLGAIEAETPVAVKTEGLHIRENWKARIVDESAIPREFLIPDLVKIGQYARMNKDKATMPGVEFYCEKTAVAR